jgi:dimethylamine monooxygenase subunit B
MDRLTAAHPDRVHCYFDDQKQVIDLSPVLENQPIGTHLYVCGPKGMINWVLSTAEGMGWPKQALHHEEFLAPGTGLPFRSSLRPAARPSPWAPRKALLEAMEAAGVDAPYLCRGGACGQCETNVHEMRWDDSAPRPLADSGRAGIATGRSCPASAASRARPCHRPIGDDHEP